MRKLSVFAAGDHCDNLSQSAIHGSESGAADKANKSKTICDETEHTTHTELLSIHAWRVLAHVGLLQLAVHRHNLRIISRYSYKNKRSALNTTNKDADLVVRHVVQDLEADHEALVVDALLPVHDGVVHLIDNSTRSRQHANTSTHRN